MKAVILLGGQGTRLQALYPDRPKALVPVAGRPFIEWQVDWLRRGGVTGIHLAAGYKADQIEAWADGQADIAVTHEPEPLGTGGALKFIERYLRDERFLVVNGDTLLPNLDFQRLEKQHQNVSNDWKTTIAITHIEEAGRFGTVEFTEKGRITAFLEKADRKAGWINGGVYIMDRSVLDRIPAGRAYSFETDLFPAMIAEGALFAHQTKPPLLDMGTPDGLETMERWLQRHAGA